MKKLLTLLCLSSLICMASPGTCYECGYFSEMPYQKDGKKYCSKCYFKYDIYKQHEDSIGDWVEFFIYVVGPAAIIGGYFYSKKNKTSTKH